MKVVDSNLCLVLQPLVFITAVKNFVAQTSDDLGLLQLNYFLSVSIGGRKIFQRNFNFKLGRFATKPIFFIFSKLSKVS